MGKPDSDSSNLIITFSNDFYKFYYALSLASTLKATGKGVRIFISGYACHFIKKNWQDYDKEGINEEKLNHIMDIKNNKRGRISEYVKKYPKAEFIKGKKPWAVKCDVALPSATQNEVNGTDAKTLLKNGCICVAEGANMPCDHNAIKQFKDNKILFAPGKASNAGGVAVSGLEMAQNSLRYSWTREEVDEKLKEIMIKIHKKCLKYGKEKDYVDYGKGANISSFIKVADAMLAQGVV